MIFNPQLRKIVSTLSFVLVLGVGLFFSTSLVKADPPKQPAGQMPIVEPLLIPEAGVQPNYSKNIEDNGEVNKTVVTEDVQSENSTDDSGTTQVPVKSKALLYWIIAVAVIVIVIVYVLWKRGVIVITSGEDKALKSLFALLIVPSLLVLFSYNVKFVSAQSLPTNKPPIQRIIVEEGSDDFLSNSNTPPAVRAANNTVIYTLGAVALIIIAVGAAVTLWYNQPHNLQKLKPRAKPSSKSNPKKHH